MPSLAKSTSHDTTPAAPLPKQVSEAEVSRIAIVFIIGSVTLATILLATAVVIYLKYI